ncbi:hypothetical protein [Desulfosporosinus meridiei]|uniref:Uncharacterized protein n=1 Tax=Desulfosporosinus meridiei (strain ATCC BAA-275 / DSM 13257 / KCTC 12902 / NCIMB 13706 / S10) TaxID=768704 RepID=J7IYE6_DESMD|nr:hypothetical protein [Desulfosporosinus meridiei]AFQ45169.1 hypothetical protein Desmer_3293 [Desulfosporosinus meridiei DSM 13257]
MVSDQDLLKCSTKHSEPAIFSETYSLALLEKVKSERVTQALTQWIEEIRDWTSAKAYFVGHIKVFVEGQENLWLSSTGRRISCQQSQGWSEWSLDSATLCVTVIVFGTTKEALQVTAEESLKTCFKTSLPNMINGF